MIDIDESDRMIKISGKVDKSGSLCFSDPIRSVWVSTGRDELRS